MFNKRNGVNEWIFQRVSNVLILIWSATYLALFFCLESYDFTSWQQMHQALWFKVFSSVILAIVMLNSILAGWQIGTDYTQKVPIKGFSGFFHGFYMLGSAAFLAFGLYILWLI